MKIHIRRFNASWRVVFAHPNGRKVGGMGVPTDSTVIAHNMAVATVEEWDKEPMGHAWLYKFDPETPLSQVWARLRTEERATDDGA